MYSSQNILSLNRSMMSGPVVLGAKKNVDSSILGRIASGDQSAVNQCIDRYGGLVWSIVRRMAPSNEEAEDLVQEVFIDVWKSADRYDPNSASEKTFIAMIARRRLIDRIRQIQRRPQENELNEALDFESDEHQKIEKSLEAQAAAQYLADLKPEQRRVLHLSIYLGMSHGEIATATDMPIGTVKSHVRRGLIAIREKLQANQGSLDGREAT